MNQKKGIKRKKIGGSEQGNDKGIRQMTNQLLKCTLKWEEISEINRS